MIKEKQENIFFLENLFSFVYIIIWMITPNHFRQQAIIGKKKKEAKCSSKFNWFLIDYISLKFLEFVHEEWHRIYFHECHPWLLL